MVIPIASSASLIVFSLQLLERVRTHDFGVLEPPDKHLPHDARVSVEVDGLEIDDAAPGPGLSVRSEVEVVHVREPLTARPQSRLRRRETVPG